MKTASRRVIPVILHSKGGAVKTVQFNKPKYVGDTLNTALIFSELNVDELAVFDIDASVEKRGPNLELVRSLSAFCSMPICYGGGIVTITDAEKLFRLGVEKVSLNAALEANPGIISDIAERFGNQAVRVSVDVKLNSAGTPTVWFKGTGGYSDLTLLDYARKAQELGAGEVMVTSVGQEGTWAGPALEMGAAVAEELEIPVVLNGGISSTNDIESVLLSTECSGVGVSSLFLFQKPASGILVGITSV